MSLQKKCLTASAITHGLLLLLVFVGSAFIPQKPKLDGPEFEIFELPSDFELVAEDNVFSGGNPNARKGDGFPTPQPVQPQQLPPPATPPQQTPKTEDKPIVKPPEIKPEPVKQPDPSKVKQPVAETKKPKLDADDFKIPDKKTAKQEPKKAEPKKDESFDLKDILSKAEKRTVTTQSKPSAADDKAAREKQLAAANASALADARRKLDSKLGSGGSPAGTGNIDDILGPGGARVASYSLYLAGIYRSAWIAPAKSSARTPVRIKVTISRDGVVLASEVLNASGNRDFDRAADATVKRVRRFDRPPPTREPSVTYTLEFIPPD